MAGSNVSGIEISAVSVLKRAVEHDQAKRYTSSLVCYQEGIQLLMDAIKETKDGVRQAHLRERATSYMDRAERIKLLVQKEKDAGTYHEQIQIHSGSTGHSYESVFGHLLDDSIQMIEIDDPYIRAIHQIQNFIRLCELLVKKCPKLICIALTTGQDQMNANVQSEKLNSVAASLHSHNVKLKILYSQVLHDREIRLDSGWIIKIGRGLDYFKQPDNKFSLGFFDLDLRSCHETTVDIFHRKFVRQNSSS